MLKKTEHNHLQDPSLHLERMQIKIKIDRETGPARFLQSFFKAIKTNMMGGFLHIHTDVRQCCHPEISEVEWCTAMHQVQEAKQQKESNKQKLKPYIHYDDNVW